MLWVRPTRILLFKWLVWGVPCRASLGLWFKTNSSVGQLCFASGASALVSIVEGQAEERSQKSWRYAPLRFLCLSPKRRRPRGPPVVESTGGKNRIEGCGRGNDTARELEGSRL